jgi:sterol desaturase/sphingolipid hydroxylase (fatty acid hydroxylase superfamily)
MIFLHDTYFYWAHRLMHQPKLFRYFHNVHHKSTNPSPWAAYAFQPLEGIVEAAIIFPIIFLIPFHKTALLAFLIFMMTYNVYGHLGYEIFPKTFNKHPIGRWLNTSVNHNQHHKYFTGNFGLYFLFWDRWLGTIRNDYDTEFAEVDSRRSR